MPLISILKSTSALNLSLLVSNKLFPRSCALERDWFFLFFVVIGHDNRLCPLFNLFWIQSPVYKKSCLHPVMAESGYNGYRNIDRTVENTIFRVKIPVGNKFWII